MVVSDHVRGASARGGQGGRSSLQKPLICLTFKPSHSTTVLEAKGAPARAQHTAHVTSICQEEDPSADTGQGHAGTSPLSQGSAGVRQLPRQDECGLRPGGSAPLDSSVGQRWPQCHSGVQQISDTV